MAVVDSNRLPKRLQNTYVYKAYNACSFTGGTPPIQIIDRASRAHSDSVDVLDVPHDDDDDDDMVYSSSTRRQSRSYWKMSKMAASMY